MPELGDHFDLGSDFQVQNENINPRSRLGKE